MENFSENHDHIKLRLFDVRPNFLSPRVKGSVIIIIKHCLCELPHEWKNEIRFSIIGN